MKIASAAGTGATVMAAGSGNLTITGVGGTGTSGNMGVDIAGATINTIAGISIAGTGGQGSDSDLGVTIDGISDHASDHPGDCSRFRAPAAGRAGQRMKLA